jgi:hypothetical protein
MTEWRCEAVARQPLSPAHLEKLPARTFHKSRCTKPLRGREPVAKVCSPIVQLRMLDLRI